MPILGVTASSISGHLFTDTGVMFPIGMVQVGSAGAANIEFTSIPSTYKHLQIRAIARGSDGGGIYTQFNSSTAANYSSHNINGDGTTAAAQAQASTSTPLIIRNNGISTTANTFTALVVDILDYASTSKNKTLRSLGGHDINGAGGLIEFASNLWFISPVAITSIKMTHNGSGFTQYSQFALYGIKGE